ncbi:MAG: retropepsin-like aspartic protease [Candidatus Binatia bacterium]
MRRVAVGFLAVSLLMGVAATPRARARDLVVGETGEAALAQPMVVLGVADKPAAAAKSRFNPLEDLPDDLPSVAILDTGASGHVLSAATAARFGLKAETGSRYVETGMSGDHSLEVSRPATLDVTDLVPEDEDAPRGRRGQRTAPASVRLSGQRVLLNEAPSDLSAALLSPGSIVDVIGMPLIRDHVVEIEPQDEAGAALAVRLHPSAAGLAVDAWVALTLVDFNRRDPRNRGPVPSLATNPVVPGVRTVLGAADAEGDWLLDTGATCTMISTATAKRLGLVDASGTPTRRPAFTLPVGGIGGGSTSLQGFRLDRLELRADRGRTLVFPDAAVVVHDITTTRADGITVTLDGLLGMNLLLPSGSGMTMLGAGGQRPSPFARVVIDAAGERLGFALAE